MDEEKQKIKKNSLCLFKTSDIVAKFIIEKIFSNIKIELNRKKINSLVNTICISHTIKELNMATQ